MNLALPAVILLLFALPGYLLRSQFARPERTAPDTAPFGRALGSVLILALVLNAAWVWLAEHTTIYRVDWDALMVLIAGARGDLEPVIHRATRHPEGVFYYLASLYAFAWLAGFISRELIQRLHLDQRVPQLQMDAPWYYLFAGRLDEGEEPDGVIVSAVVEIGSQAYIYMGLLNRYYFHPDGSPDRLVLSNVSRRKLESDRAAGQANEEAFYPIQGDYFVLRYAETKTINIFYWRQADLPDAPEDAT